MRAYRLRLRPRKVSAPVAANRPAMTTSRLTPPTAPPLHPAPVLGAIGVGVVPGVRSPACVLTGEGVAVGGRTVGVGVFVGVFGGVVAVGVGVGGVVQSEHTVTTRWLTKFTRVAGVPGETLFTEAAPAGV